MSKSFVAMGYSLCPACGTQHDEVVLLDRRLKDSMGPRMCTGYALCPQCQSRAKDGYVALCEVAERADGKYRLENVKFLGRVVHMRREVYAKVFHGAPLAADDYLCFTSTAVIDYLAKLLGEPAAA